MRLDNNKFSLLIAGASAAVYIVCSAFVAFFPELSTKLMMALFHISGSINLGARVTFAGFILGLIQAVVYAYVLGWIFAWVFSKSLSK